MNLRPLQFRTWTLAISLATMTLAAADSSLELPVFDRPQVEELAPFTSEKIPSGFRHIGDFLLYSRVKVTDGVPQTMPIKPLRLQVYTDGITVRVHTEGEDSGHSTFEIYRSDGIGRQSEQHGALEVIPGVQASSNQGGVLRHLRASREMLTITLFPGVSNQTIISTARAVSEPTADTPPLSQGPRP